MTFNHNSYLILFYAIDLRILISDYLEFMSNTLIEIRFSPGKLLNNE